VFQRDTRKTNEEKTKGKTEIKTKETDIQMESDI
jgi:hypothetical protein